ncbi:alpha/beta hydrolase [Streptomyces sp. TS71-3]|uniref:alpha/beta hydrolase n=1 Tax=Streptomyces sp. TS71-3 TaxID=2733862 RepID=UPI001B10BD6D|nr:alpha/beta hydrolase [Streptomyces sp. TS71-3]GHJ37138.1 hypothetical protein Sm713_27470 [Streptomyces sp. TS71-3]
MIPPPRDRAEPSATDGTAHPPPYRPVRVLHRPTAPAAAVLLLHGGRADGLAPPSPVNLPGWRMRPVAWAIHRHLRAENVLLAAVRYRHRGWNGEHAHAAQDAREALAELTGVAGVTDMSERVDVAGPADMAERVDVAGSAGGASGIPVVLVGHSMGGRAALSVAGAPGVRGVVALAPWCPLDEPVAHLSGRTVFLLHDPADRVTKAAGSWAFGERARDAGAHVHTVEMPAGGHTMLRGARNWHRLTAQAVATILGAAPPPPGPQATATGESA